MAVSIPSSPAAPKPVARQQLSDDNAAAIWTQAAERCSGLLADSARQCERVAISAPNRLVVVFKPEYTFAKSTCGRPENAARLQQALAGFGGVEISPVDDTLELGVFASDLPHGRG